MAERIILVNPDGSASNANLLPGVREGDPSRVFLQQPIGDAVTSVAGRTGNVTLSKGDVGLSSVDNTSDVNKPVSTATQAALDAKIPTEDLGQPLGPAQLDASGLLKAENFPEIVIAQLRRGTDAERLAITLADGEPFVVKGDTDIEKNDRLYIGDGSTLGGSLANGQLFNRRGASTALADALYFPGISGAYMFTPLGTPGSGIGAGKLTKSDLFVCPTANPSAEKAIWFIGAGSSTYDSPSANWSLIFYITTAGGLRVQLNSGDPNYYSRSVTVSNFVTKFAGQPVLADVTWDGATAPVIALWGKVQTTVETNSPSGAPAWTQAVSDAYLVQGRFGTGSFFSGLLRPGPLINRVWSAAEIAKHADTLRLPDSDLATPGSMVAQTSGTLTVGWRYRIAAYVAGDSFTNVGASSNATGVEFVATTTTPTTWTNSSSLIKVGCVYDPVIQPINVVADRTANGLAGILFPGANGSVIPITSRRDWVIQALTATNGNKQLFDTTLFADYTKHVLVDWIVNGTSTATTSAGSTSGGTQYKASGALSSGRNILSLVTRILASASLYWASNTTDQHRHTIYGRMVD